MGIMRGSLATHPGVRLEDAILADLSHDFLSILDDAWDEEDDAWFASNQFNPFEEYQGRILDFCKNVLNVSLTPEVEDMLTSAQDNPKTLARSANGTGKTFAAACLAVYWFIVYDDAQVFTIAAPPEENLRLLLWGEIGAIVEKNPGLFSSFKVSLASLHIQRHKKSFITGLAIPQAANKGNLKARFSGKHAPHLLFIADEGDAIPEEIYSAIEGCMSGGMVRLLILFNPRMEAGPVYRMEKNGRGKLVQLTAFNHPNVLTGQDRIPGAVSREITVKRIVEWSDPLPGNEEPDLMCFEVPSYLVGYVAHDDQNRPYPPLKPGFRRINNMDFFTMVLGDYPAQGADQLISKQWIKNAQVRMQLWKARYGNRPPTGIRPVGGYDVAELGDDWNFVTLYFGSYMAPQIGWKEEVDVIMAGDRAADIYFSNRADWINVDSTGIGAGAWAQMRRRKCIAYRIMVQSNQDLKEKGKKNETELKTLSDSRLAGFDSIRSQMLWDFREWLRTDKGAMIPDCPKLEEEMLAPTYSKNIRQEIAICGSEELKARLGRSPDRLMSAAIRFAVQPHEESGPVEAISYLNGNGNGNGTHRNGKSKLLATGGKSSGLGDM
jgi:hypothetical protein